MGKLDTLLSIGSVGIEVAQLNQLQQMRRQGASAEAIGKLLAVLRNEIFQYNQAATEVLEMEARYPKAAAGAMRILQVRLEESGLTPELFSELSDKEYVATTTRLIRQNSTRLLEQLPLQEQEEVNSVSAEWGQLPDYVYYIDNYERYQAYQQALPDYEKAKAQYDKSQNRSCLMLVGLLIAIPVSSILFGVVFQLFGSIFSDDAGGTGFLCGTTLGAILALAGFIYLTQFRPQSQEETGRISTQEYRTLKQTVESAQKDLDLQRFANLEQRLGTDYEAVVALRQRAEEMIREFFGSSGMPQLLPG